MLYQESSGLEMRSATRSEASEPVSVLAYRSRPITVPTALELDRLLHRAQQRNRAEGVTGLLIYDQGCFFQWLEGPKLGLARIWDSVQRDARHTDFKILRQQIVAKRFFSGWDMRLARRTRGHIDRTLAIMQAPHELLARLRTQPSMLGDLTWDDVFSDAVLPAVAGPDRIALPRHTFAPYRESTATIWHAARTAATELAGTLLSLDPADTVHYLDALVDEGAGLEPLFREVFEPAARCLGGLWEEDRCDDLTIGLALGRLELEAHRLSSILRDQADTRHPGHAVLVTPLPGEMHALNAALGGELFLRDGWEVSYEIMSNDNSLSELLRETWFDVLDLTLSTALARDGQLPAMRLAIGAARAASLNPALAVMVEGRSFLEHPLAYRQVGADIGCTTVTQSVPAALRWLRTKQLTQTANAALQTAVQVSATR